MNGWIERKSAVMPGLHELTHRECTLRVYQLAGDWTFTVLEPLTADTAYAKIHATKLYFKTFEEVTASAVKWTDDNIKELYWNK